MHRGIGFVLLVGALPFGSGPAAAQDVRCFTRAESLDLAAARPSPLQDSGVQLASGRPFLCYGAPSARGREVMGGLVPFGEPWRMGANEATVLHLPFAARIGGIPVEAGSYSLWAVPGEDVWEIHVNGLAERWGIPIDEAVRAADLGSFTVAPEAVSWRKEMLGFSWVQQSEDAALLILEWESTQVPILVEAAEGEP